MQNKECVFTAGINYSCEPSASQNLGKWGKEQRYVFGEVASFFI